MCSFPVLIFKAPVTNPNGYEAIKCTESPVLVLPEHTALPQSDTDTEGIDCLLTYLKGGRSELNVAQ